MNTADSIILQSKKRRATALDGISDPGAPAMDVSRARPTWEDMVIAYSTIPGYASLRDHEHGTWFVQSLVEVFMTHAHDTELVDLLRMTSERLSHFTNEQGDKQTCNVEMRSCSRRHAHAVMLTPSHAHSHSFPFAGICTRGSTSTPASVFLSKAGRGHWSSESPVSPGTARGWQSSGPPAPSLPQ